MSLKFFKTVYFYFLILFASLTFFSCGTTPPFVTEICNTSSDICNVVNGACANVPPGYDDICNIANEICNYTNLICSALPNSNLNETTKSNVLIEMKKVKSDLDNRIGKLKTNKTIEKDFYINLKNQMNDYKNKLIGIYAAIR